MSRRDDPELRELGVLAASLLHELRQPLFAMKGLVQVTRADPDEDKAALRLEQLLAQIEYMEALVAHYGAFGREDPVPVRFDLNDPVRAAVRMLSFRAERYGAELHAELSTHPLPVRCRQVAIRQVAINLVQNAFDAVRGTGDAQVWVRTRKDDRHVLLEVEDTGPGVPEHLKSRLFEPFVSSKPPDEGTGLGLFIVSRLVTEAGGALALDPTTGGGTRVTLSLPAAA